MSLILSAENIVNKISEIQVKKNNLVMSVFSNTDIEDQDKIIIVKHFHLLDKLITKSRNSTINESDQKIAIYTILENSLKTLKDIVSGIDLILKNISNDKNISKKYDEEIKALSEIIKETTNEAIESFFV